ncbi:fructosamine kinase family protein [Oceanobacillus halophilus]|uniref:fructosamine kinase family protein n=1 Tax=Oceanobacillus halophilus TaxID=930130 RepID=UPI00240DBC5C|nr:fructosamine kinase family protein [Oceanobacillus halophilus]
MKRVIQQGLRKMGYHGEDIQVMKVSGGDINETFYVPIDNDQYFVKLNREVSPAFFNFEAEGLNKIRETKSIRVPKVYGVYEVSQVPMLWMEWIEGEKENHTETLLGEQVAKLHQCEGPGYGYNKESYIGKLKQNNKIVHSWITYYRDYRLKGQLSIGRNRGTIRGNREKRLIKGWLSISN